MQQSVLYTGGHLLEYVESFAFSYNQVILQNIKWNVYMYIYIYICIHMYIHIMAMTTPLNAAMIQ